MTPAVIALLPEAVSFVRWLLERYGGNRDAARAALRRIRDEWAEWERTKSAQSAELERVIKRRADFDDLRRASNTGPIPGELTPLEKPRGPKP